MTDFDRLCVLSTQYFRVTYICLCRKETSLDLVQRKVEMTPAISCKQLVLRLNDTVHDFPIVMMTSVWHAL